MAEHEEMDTVRVHLPLRDIFAAHIIGGMLAHYGSDAPDTLEPKVAAEYAYRMADAMLAERRNRG